jgi:flagellin
MSLVVNTNVSSLTAQRALAYADSLQGEAMTRLSTGSKINSASDDAAGLAIAQRMTAQVNGLNMAVKNANDGIALTKSVEGALVEVADMLQRLRELAIQSANDTNTGVDRQAIHEEVQLLTQEISRVSANTRFNNQKVLDGTFSNVNLQVGTMAGETISFSLDSTSADALGSYKLSGDIIQAQVGAGSGSFANITDAADDIIVNGNSVTKTIDVAALDSAKAVASKINAVTGETGVSAEAKTFAKIYSANRADQTLSVKINNFTTGDFVMSSSNVLDAIDKINAISGKTGVTASATAANEVLLFSSDGSDILVENEKALTSLRMKTVGFDGSTEVKELATLAKKVDSGILTASTAHTFKNLTSGHNVAFTTTSATSAAEYESLINNSLNVSAGTSAVRVSSLAVASNLTGDYYLTHNPTGDVYKLNLAAATVAGWESALDGAILFGGDHDNIARSLKDDVMVTLNGDKLQLTGARNFGDFDVYSDSITSLTVMDSAHGSHRVGVEGQGIEVTQTASDATSRTLRYSNEIVSLTDATAQTSFSAVSAKAMRSVGTNESASLAAMTTAGVLTEESKLSFFSAYHASNTNDANTVTVIGKDRYNNVITETVDLNANVDGNTLTGTKTDGVAGVSNETLVFTEAQLVGTNLFTASAANSFTIEANGEVFSFDVTLGANANATDKTNNATAIANAMNRNADFANDYTVTVTSTHSITITADGTGTNGGNAVTNTDITDMVVKVGSNGSAAGQTKQMFKEITSIQASAATNNISVRVQENTDNYSYRAARGMGDFDIVEGSDATVTTSAITSAVGKTELYSSHLPTSGSNTYKILNKTTGITTDLSLSGNATTVTVWNTALDAALGAGKVVAAAGGGGATQATAQTIVFTGASSYIGDFEILDSNGNQISTKGMEGQFGTAASVTGDIDTMDIELAATGGQDSGTAQGTVELSSSKVFSVTQSSPELAYSTTAPVGPANDNYFTTKAAALSTVSNVDLRSQKGASNAISVLDGAIEKISSMRSSLGAIENRLDHTVSNLMNISENTEDARSRIQDADFAAESAKLSKAQVLKQAGVGMLAQANAGAQLVLQLLQ